MKNRKIVPTLVTLTILASVFVVLNTQVLAYPGEQLRFEWVDDDGDYFNDNDVDGVIPFIPSIEQLPLILKFQILNETDFYEPAGNTVWSETKGVRPADEKP